MARDRPAREPARGARAAAGRSRCPSRSGRARCCRGACPATSPAELDELCASGEVVWVGAGLDRVALYFREDAPLLGRRRRRAARPRARRTTRSAPRSRARREFWPDLLAATGARRRGGAAGALGARLGRRGDERRLDAAARGAPLRGCRGASGAPRRFSRTRARGAITDAGPLVARPSGSSPSARRTGARSPSSCSSGRASSRATASAARGFAGGYGAVYGELRALETLGVCRRGYFVEGLGGAQFALAGAVERLRELRRARRRGAEPLVLAAADPAQPYGAALPWPKRAGARAARVAGAHVVLLGGEAALFVERGGRSLVPLREPDEDWLRPALAALVEHVRGGRGEAPRGRALRRRARSPRPR